MNERGTKMKYLAQPSVIEQINFWEKRHEKEIRGAIAILLIAAWIFSLIAPARPAFAQSISTLPGMKQSAGIVEKIAQKEDFWAIQSNTNLGRIPEALPPHSSNMSAVTAPASSLNERDSARALEGRPLAGIISGARAHHFPAQEAKTVLPAKTGALPLSAKTSKTALTGGDIAKKLEVLAEALINYNIKGLAALKQDEFMDAYLAAIGMDLASWMSDMKHEKYFLDIFKIEGPWVLIFLAMSPTSMHEYMQDIELFSTDGGITEAQRLPVNMTVETRKGNLLVEVQGAYDLWITFQVDEKGNVSVVSE